ncbi:MAG TPA: glutaredoxin family protein [Microbacterium sp.]|uniref:glutaredoxin family protein n=1 Tax=Microbacterium sp. TaxID=51671 RepID=UPI002B45F786|nr:glutaredoxin family protein [Microbacterium sp.]HKT55659.1 glutaredoxin family protein [Microbacterium sp.]
MVSVTVCTTGPGCMQCKMTEDLLRELGIRFTVVDLHDNPNGRLLQHVTADLGYTQAPVVLVDGDPTRHWSGFQDDLLKRLAADPNDQSGRARSA